MSWSPPQCPKCSSFSTHFDCTVPYGPPELFGLYWDCERCSARLLEFCPTGVDEPRPGGCLNCGAAVEASGCCPNCGVHRAQLVARVHAQCGAPPQLEAVRELAERGLFRVAFNAVDLLLEQQPEDPRVLVVKAKLLTEVQRAERAVPLLRRALELGVEEPGVAIDLGVALAGCGRHQEAIAVYEAALVGETDPFRRAVILTNIGGCFSALGNARLGEEYHRRAVTSDPEHLGPRWNLFANLFCNQRYEDALEVVEQTIELPFLEVDERENLQAYRAEVLLALGRHWDALAAIDRSLASDPHELNRLTTRARILICLDLLDAARACVAKMLAVDPDDRNAKQLLKRIDRKTAPASKN